MGLYKTRRSSETIFLDIAGCVKCYALVVVLAGIVLFVVTVWKHDHVCLFTIRTDLPYLVNIIKLVLHIRITLSCHLHSYKDRHITQHLHTCTNTRSVTISPVMRRTPAWWRRPCVFSSMLTSSYLGRLSAISVTMHQHKIYVNGQSQNDIRTDTQTHQCTQTEWHTHTDTHTHQRLNAVNGWCHNQPTSISNTCCYITSCTTDNVKATNRTLFQRFLTSLPSNSFFSFLLFPRLKVDPQIQLNDLEEC